MKRQSYTDLLLITAWCYGNGFIFGWAFPLVELDPLWTAALFSVIGWVFGFWGILRRERTGRFPAGIAYIVWPLPFTFSFMGVVWWVLDNIYTWLGLD